MKELIFERIGESDYYNLFIDGKLIKTMLTMEQVMRIIAEKEKDDENNN